MASNIVPGRRPLQYQSTYAGIPLEEVKESMAMGAQQFDANLADINATKVFMANIRSLPGDEEYVQGTFKNALKAIDEISTQSDGTKRYDLAGQAVDRMKLQIHADPKINAAIQSYANFDKAEQDKAAIRAKGGTPLEFNDPTKHKSFNPDGSINIFRPHIEEKGDYIKEAAGLWNTLAPELISAKLSQSDVEGILEGRTIKGITPEMVKRKFADVKQAYASSDSGVQQRKVFAKDGSKNPDADMDNFLLGIGMLKTHLDTNVAYQSDPEWKARKDMEETQVRAMASMYKKQMSGRGNLHEKADAEKWFTRIRTNYTAGKSGLDKAIMIGINSDILGTGLSKTLPIPQRDTFQLVGMDGKGIDQKDIELTQTPKVVGIVSTNAHGDAYRGGYYANVEYKVGANGKPKMGTIIIKNGNDIMSNKVSTIAGIEDAVVKDKKLDGHLVPDTGGILAFADSKIQDLARARGGTGNSLKIGFVVDPQGDKIHAKVKPVLYEGNEKNVIGINSDMATSLGVKESYTLDEIYALTQDLLAREFEPYAQTKASLQEQVPAKQ